MQLFIPCTVVSGRVRVLAVPRAPGTRVLSFTNHHRALEAGNAIVANSWVFCDHEGEYATYEATGEEDVSVWETELGGLVEAGMAVGPQGFGLDSCAFNKSTMLVTVVNSIDVQVEFDMDAVRERLEMLKDLS
jgi:hypothetical protein